MGARIDDYFGKANEENYQLNEKYTQIPRVGSSRGEKNLEGRCDIRYRPFFR